MTHKRTNYGSEIDPSVEDIDCLPLVELHEPDERVIRVLRALQVGLLKHPVAGQAAFNALVSEGRAFAKTAQGRATKGCLERSGLLHRARVIFDFSTLSLLEEDPPEIMPSAYLDVLFMLASSDRSDEIIHRLFGGGASDD